MPVPPVPVYHVKVAPVPAIPFAVISVVADKQIGLATAVAEVMLTLVLTLTKVVAQVVAPQSPLYLT